MIKDDLTAFLKTTGTYYGLEKIVNPQRFNLWFDEVKTIPSESLPYIQACLFADRDSMPRNIPKYMKQYFSQWLSANPAKVATRSTKTVCDECDSRGLIWFKKSDGNEYVARCARCTNWTRHFSGAKQVEGVPQLMTNGDIGRQGWEAV